MYEREQVETISRRITEMDNPLMQVVVGPRQTGKSTMIAQALNRVDQARGGIEHRYVSADDALFPSIEWLRTEWQQARNVARSTGRRTVFVIDEVQKVEHWPNAVKSLFDADRRDDVDVKPVLSASSSLLLHKGLEDSLMGRFELIRSPHWSFSECAAAFGFTLDDYLFFGGYPGAARLVSDESRWSTYMRDAIIEPTISQDVLSMEDVRKPALLRSMFRLGALYSAQELSFNKMLGQLQDAGNTTTLAHYLELLSKAGMVTGLQRFSPKETERRKSSPRLMVYDTSLMTSVSEKGRERIMGEPDLRGRLVESAVGARLLARAPQEGFSVWWWREGNDEVDFVLCKGRSLSAIEVKGGHETRRSGMAKFLAKYPEARRIVVGGSSSGACTVEAFLRDEVPLFW